MKKTTTKKSITPSKKAVKTSGSSPILKEVKQLYAFMQDNNLDTIEYDHKGVYLRLVKTKPAMVPVPVSIGGAVASATNANGTTALQEQYKEVIKSSLMGIFFRGSTPSAPPFVKEGARVEKGDVICLIEAMKVFNEVRAEFPCIIKKVLVENGKPVKQGDILFAIERV
ncbi:MAG: biotin/lipoyl-binding protein [Elusimicrobiaceae bacterium]|nr:biotin/lipoyl-binding protein [Elusimicrobiaceae bacterium]